MEFRTVKINKPEDEVKWRKDLLRKIGYKM